MRLRLPAFTSSILPWIQGLLAAAVCAYGAVVFTEEVDKHYAVDNWLIWRLLPIWGYAVVFNLACVSAGAALLRGLFGRKKLPVLEWLLQSMAVGLVLFVLGLHLAGWLCALTPALAVALPLICLAAGAFGVPPLWRASRRWVAERPQPSPGKRAVAALAAGLGAAMIVFVYLEALPVNAINYDAKWYHFPVAQDYARTGCIVPLPGDDHRTFPHLTSMVQAWALLVPKLSPDPLRWMLALHLEFTIVVWRIVGVAAGLCWMLDQKRTHGLWATFFLFPSIFIYDQNIGGSADHFLGFFAIPILLALARTLAAFEWRWGVVLAFVLGGHMLTKYQAVYLFAGVTAIGLLRWLYLAARRHPRLRREGDPSIRHIAKGLGAVILCTAVVTSPHLVKNAVFYNNPLYPLAQSVFTDSFPQVPPGYYEPTGERRGPFHPKHEGLERQKWIAEFVYGYSFETHNRHWTHRRPYMGSLFSLLLPCLVVVRRSRRIWLATALGLIAFFVWGNTAVNDRYLLSFYDIFIATAGALMVRVWQLGWIARTALVPLVAMQLFWGGDAPLFYGWKRLRNTRRLIARGYKGKTPESWLKRYQRKQRRITEATPRDAVILSRNYKMFLGLDRKVINDIPRQAGGYISYSHLRDVHELYEHYRERGITHLLYPHGRRSPPRWNNTVLFDELVHHHAVNEKRFGHLRLAEMPPEPPEPSAPYMVFAHGVKGYPNGLFRVEQLDVSNWHPHLYPRPEPEMAYRKKNAQKLIHEADAAVVCRGRLDAGGRKHLARLFDRFERFRRCSVYLRKRGSPEGR